MNIKHTVLPNIRNIKLNLIVEAISSNEESSKYESKEITDVALQAEAACLETAMREIAPNTDGLLNPLCEEIYHLKVARIIGFFEDEATFKKLFKKIHEGDIKVSDLPDVNISELFPERYVVQLARINETGKDIPVKYTTLYHCRRCKQNKCSIQSAQTRSLDECNTIFVNCLACGNVFTV
jgi:DNA-directed RNA polymerase subunit M/transcription elongation factor TFIIS